MLTSFQDPMLYLVALQIWTVISIKFSEHKSHMPPGKLQKVGKNDNSATRLLPAEARYHPEWQLWISGRLCVPMTEFFDPVDQSLLMVHPARRTISVSKRNASLEAHNLLSYFFTSPSPAQPSHALLSQIFLVCIFCTVNMTAQLVFYWIKKVSKPPRR